MKREAIQILRKLEDVIPQVDSKPIYFNGNPDSVNAGALATKRRLKIYDAKASLQQGIEVGKIIGVVAGIMAVAGLGKALQ
jgi:hypothetical protein